LRSGLGQQKKRRGRGRVTVSFKKNADKPAYLSISWRLERKKKNKGKRGGGGGLGVPFSENWKKEDAEAASHLKFPDKEQRKGKKDRYLCLYC